MANIGGDHSWGWFGGGEVVVSYGAAIGGIAAIDRYPGNPDHGRDR